MKKISVIIPAYNCGKYIERCVESLLKQSGAELEIIAVNDGSTDDTLQKLLKYGDRITIKNINNMGVSGARNLGLSCAHGDFLMFVDGDDYLTDGAIQRLVSAQSENDADIVRFRYKCVYPNGAAVLPKSQLNRYEFIEKQDFPKAIYPLFLRGIVLNSVCVSMYRRDVVKNIKFRTDMSAAEDAVFSLSAFTNAKNVQLITDILYEYYQSNEGLTGRGISVIRKYRDNYRFAAETAKLLKTWGMNTPKNYVKVYMRPIILTFDKVERILKGRNACNNAQTGE